MSAGGCHEQGGVRQNPRIQPLIGVELFPIPQRSVVAKPRCGGKTEHMPDDTLVRKLSDLDRLLNDPDVPMEPMLIWRLASEIAKHEVSAAAPPGIQDTGLEY
jgi:hypothetical protein